MTTAVDKSSASAVTLGGRYGGLLTPQLLHHHPGHDLGAICAPRGCAWDYASLRTAVGSSVLRHGRSD